MCEISKYAAFRNSTTIVLLHVPIPTTMLEEDSRAHFLANRRAANTLPSLGEKKSLGEFLDFVPGFCREKNRETQKLVKEFLSGDLLKRDNSPQVREAITKARRHIEACPVHRMMARTSATRLIQLWMSYASALEASKVN